LIEWAERVEERLIAGAVVLSLGIISLGIISLGIMSLGFMATKRFGL